MNSGEPNIFFQLGLATFLGSFLGYWLMAKHNLLTVAIAFAGAFSLLTVFSLPEWDVLVASAILFLFMTASVPFAYYIHSIDQRRAAKKQQRQQDMKNTEKHSKTTGDSQRKAQ